uniref:methyl-accepting chemotaxis protein n=1 Tax=Acetatifactor sp. TaxID=1872090 RepID=UPI004055E3BE
MDKINLDLSNKVNAEASRNKTALIGVIIMNLVICIAYVVEVLKGGRTIDSFLIMATICVVPIIAGIFVYLRKKNAPALRYILGIGFLLFYGYILFTTKTDMPFCYVLVAVSIFIVYADHKFSIMIGLVALAINVGVLIKKMVATGLTPEQITNTEIMLACVLLTCVFSVLATKKITEIGQASTNKADSEKEQSDKLLETTLAVANVITESIGEAVGETESLNQAIGATQQSMEDLSNGTNDTMQAIMEQQKSTNEIADYIENVEVATEHIVKELSSAEENLNVGHDMMNELIEQVKVSEESSALATKEMEGLKENADQMQNIVGLISSVAHQTSLLSLNASIEAARAGEAGRGFAVVAGEISNLAAQTNTATGDINRLIENITVSIAEVTKAMEALLESNQHQNECVGRTAENFNKIHNSTRAISEQAEQLKQTVDAVASANEHVVESISNVSAVTEEVTASATETLTSCNSNLESIERVMKIMEQLGEEAKKLQQ